MKRILTFSNIRLAAEILLVTALVAGGFSRSFKARAESPDAPDAIGWYQCNGPSEHVAAFTNRVHLYCQSTTPIGNATALSALITWFAVPTSPDSMAAARFMSLAQTGLITGRTLWVEADPNDTSGTSFGCGSTDCRKAYGLELR